MVLELKLIYITQGKLLCKYLHVLAEIGHRTLSCACKKKVKMQGELI